MRARTYCEASAKPVYSDAGAFLRLGIAFFALAAALMPAQPAADPVSSYRALLDKYCVVCHNERAKTAGLMLDNADISNLPTSAETWEKVIQKLRANAMPPQGMPCPDPATSAAFVTWLEASIDQSASARPNPGRTAVHRLNRTEY